MGEGITLECPGCTVNRTSGSWVRMERSSAEIILSSLQLNQKHEMQQVVETYWVWQED